MYSRASINREGGRQVENILNKMQYGELTQIGYRISRVYVRHG